MRPGVSNQIISPEKALELVDSLFNGKKINQVVIGIAGPGELLYNEETFQTLELIHSKYSDAQLCACTNGLLLRKYAQRLFSLGIKYITVTLNAISPMIGNNIYSWIHYKNRNYYGVKAAKILIENQIAGLEECVNLGMITKVNSVLIPSINDFHLFEVSKKIKEIGVFIHNIMPLIPLSDFSHIPAPSCDSLRTVRDKSESVIRIFRLCKQCRADACSIPGLE